MNVVGHVLKCVFFIRIQTRDLWMTGQTLFCCTTHELDLLMVILNSFFKFIIYFQFMIWVTGMYFQSALTSQYHNITETWGEDFKKQVNFVFPWPLGNSNDATSCWTQFVEYSKYFIGVNMFNKWGLSERKCTFFIACNDSWRRRFQACDFKCIHKWRLKVNCSYSWLG